MSEDATMRRMNEKDRDKEEERIAAREEQNQKMREQQQEEALRRETAHDGTEARK